MTPLRLFLERQPVCPSEEAVLRYANQCFELLPTLVRVETELFVEALRLLNLALANDSPFCEASVTALASLSVSLIKDGLELIASGIVAIT